MIIQRAALRLKFKAKSFDRRAVHTRDIVTYLFSATHLLIESRVRHHERWASQRHPRLQRAGKAIL